MYFNILLTFIKILVFLHLNIVADKINLDRLKNYSKFLNFGEKKLQEIDKNELENAIFKSKVDILGEIFKKNIDILKTSEKLDIMFLIDASSSVGEFNFRSELKFVKKLLSDITVDFNHTRVAIITFSSPSNIVKNVDEISESSSERNKCFLLNNQINNISYSGGETFTLGAFQTAKEIFMSSNRNESKKALFLITDGYSNGGDPVPIANELKSNLVTIFTIGIENGNYKELYEISSSPGEFYSYLLDSFNEFESLARRALHVDLKNGDYIPLGFNKPCDILCEEGDCCDSNALCSCGTTTGHYSCICQPGFYGSGLKNSCLPCIPGTYSDGPNLCLPCPDVNHITTLPAYGIESCKCKEGYRATKNYGCKVLKCPKITLPIHGYFVKKKECGNVLNNACGIRCEVGYTMVGSSIRLCQMNATWSGSEPTCEVKTCSQLTPPKYGKMKCVQADTGLEYEKDKKNLPVDTICHFECENGKLLIGSKQRTCLPLSRWDGLKTTCKSIKCNKLPQIKYGKIIPSTCTSGKQEYGKMCKIMCNDGFKIVGSSEKHCKGGRGNWDKFEDTICKDVTPPEITCPKNVTTDTLPQKKFGHVSWIIPNATDNSGLEISIWTKPAIKIITEFKFQIGETHVTYFAQDAFHNKAKCSFYVIVKDNERPTIENCVNPPTFLTTEKNGANVSWDEPHIYDNSQKFKLSKSHEFGFFKMGTTTVSYNVSDVSGNTNTCKMNITVEESRCETLSDPLYGHSDCFNQPDGIQCQITCQEGYAIPLMETNKEFIENEGNNSRNFLCNHADPTWYNQEGSMFPECTVTKVPEEVIQSGEINVFPETNICNDTKELEELTNDIEASLSNEICIGNCSVNTEAECEIERKEEETNRILRKRSSNFEEIPHRNKNRKHRQKLNVKFQVRGKYINDTNLKSIKLPTNYNATIESYRLKIVCPIGFVPRKKRCVQCPRGSFHNITTNRCNSCQFGYYNDKLGQTECSPCPVHHSTKKMRSKKLNDCQGECPPGTYAKKRIMKYSKQRPKLLIERRTLMPHCRSCDIGYYQPDYGNLECSPCPNGYTTETAGSISDKQCIPTAKEICKSNECNNGTCLISNEYQYTCQCFENYIGSNCEKIVNNCLSDPCFNGGTCSNLKDGHRCICKEGFTGRLCEEIIEQCNIKCLNNGTCIENDANEFMCLCPSGYGGDYCEIKIKYCQEFLCENNGTCVEEQNTFKCYCSNGFIGRRCNILPCDYIPCEGNKLCTNILEENATKSSFNCTCPEGYTGKDCTEEINLCVSSPCLNGGICLNNITTYSCTCSSLFFGRNCEQKKNTKYILHFQKYDTNDYLKLPFFSQNITEISACLWMQTLDSINYGTLLSYATRFTDNAFTITDYTGLVIYVNNQYVVSDVLLNDGYWHHICVIWTSFEGVFKIYVDGKIIKNGTGLSSDTVIQGYGNMIIGQEQDVIGGRFSQSESFVGKMAYLDIWSSALTETEIQSHFNDCNESFFGSLFAWPEMQDHIKGNVRVTNSSFCGKCEVPKLLINGVIEVMDNVAYYSCYSGYELSNSKYKNGRKCTKASKWEGFYDPYCKKVYCGYPGHVKNAYLIGNKFYYLDKITYNCFDGFSLVGSSIITCQEDGKWLPDKPQCLGPQCVAFKQPKYSQIQILAEQSYDNFVENQTTFDVGTQIEISCDKNASIGGENVITCLENGTWDFPPPSCNLNEDQKKLQSNLNCPLEQIPQPPTNGYIDLESLYAAGNGSSKFIEYRCRLGYKLRGDNITSCIIDGYWTEIDISCEAITCVVPPLFKNMVLENEKLSKKSYNFGNMLAFKCEEGYSMFGNKIIRCMANSKWSRMQGKCIKKSCRKPILREETVIIGKSYLYGDKVTLNCPNGMAYEITCNKFGVWEGEKDNSC